MIAGAVGTAGLVQLSRQQASYGGPVGSVPFATGGSDGTGSAAAAVGTGIFRVDVIPAAPSPSHTISKLGYRHSGVADMPVSGGAGSSEGYVALHGQEGAVGNGRHLGPEHGGGGQRWAMAHQPHLHLMTSSPGGTCLCRSRVEMRVVHVQVSAPVLFVPQCWNRRHWQPSIAGWSR
jgi:hypothetical protein